MHRTRAIVAVILVGAGLVWIGQGVGIIKGSFMTGSGFWATVGAVCLVAGLALIGGGLRIRRRAARGD
jgi:UDP-3-O-[3-hydroxymyristoyl] glucosamine N-acyltransferase